MSLLTIAEVLSGEALVSPGGPVDRLTAVPDEPALWDAAGHALVPEVERETEPAVMQEELALA